MQVVRGNSIDLPAAVAVTPPSSRGKLLAIINDDDSTTASTVLSDESQSVVSLQVSGSPKAAAEHQLSPFDRFRSRLANSFIGAAPTEHKRTDDEQAEYLHQTRLRILLKNPEMFREFQASARESEAITSTGVRLALHQFLQQMKLAELLEDLQCKQPEEDVQPLHKSPTRRSFFSPFGFYTNSRSPSFLPPPTQLRRSQRSSSGGRRPWNDDASVLTFDESLAWPSLASCEDDGEDDNDDDDDDEDGDDEESGSVMCDGDDCSSIGSRSLATTYSGVSSMSSRPSSFSRKPASWRSLESRSASLRLVIYEDEDLQ
jgi:hypothetical protein